MAFLRFRSDAQRYEVAIVAAAVDAVPTLPQIVRRVYLPSMTPVLLEAVRLAMVFNFTGIILAEMYAARAGVGYLIGVWGENFMIRQLLAGILLVAAARDMADGFVQALRGAGLRPVKADLVPFALIDRPWCAESLTYCSSSRSGTRFGRLITRVTAPVAGSATPPRV